ncbi:hypothetical protein GCM10011579_063290 [Streptomyces albiflavescens]|uniref:Uncharacterized protein n=1 Tax=Streptomyces albiflavescens TaxID=1623582 RepID=A0A918D882_9ACTN|nr:hypothetical protein GCM10011579_063290 [Streptomyces albiflavescens]
MCEPGPGRAPDTEREPVPERESVPVWEPDPEQADRTPEPTATIEAPSKVRRVCVCMDE